MKIRVKKYCAKKSRTVNLVGVIRELPLQFSDNMKVSVTLNEVKSLNSTCIKTCADSYDLDR